jgi:hypothetical protein
VAILTIHSALLNLSIFVAQAGKASETNLLSILKGMEYDWIIRFLDFVHCLVFCTEHVLETGCVSTLR